MLLMVLVSFHHTSKNTHKHFFWHVAFFFMLLLKAKAFYSYWAEPATIKNLKRGLASLFQVQLKAGKVVEVNHIIILPSHFVACRQRELTHCLATEWRVRKVHSGLQGDQRSSDKDQDPGNLQDCRDRIHHPQPGIPVSRPAHCVKTINLPQSLINLDCLCPPPGLGCEQEVQFCYSVHTWRGFHPFSRGRRNILTGCQRP